MPRMVDSTRFGACVNVLKKVRTIGGWKLCPVVREANGRLRDRVRVAGRVELHSEGVYYLEWREDGRRRREAIPNPAEVLERARLKSLELEARKAGTALGMVRAPAPSKSLLLADRRTGGPVAVAAQPSNSNAERLLLVGIEAYIKERVDAALYSRLFMMGATEDVESGCDSVPQTRLLTAPASQENQKQNRGEETRNQAHSGGSSPENEITIAEAIDSYLKDVEPPQREFKTYEEYRNVLYRFRDSCKKKLVKDIDRKDCLEFMRHLYLIGNEARTVYNRIGIVQQWLRLNGITGLLHWPIARQPNSLQHAAVGMTAIKPPRKTLRVYHISTAQLLLAVI